MRHQSRSAGLRFQAGYRHLGQRLVLRENLNSIYLALTIPINAAMLGIELEGYRSAQEYIANPVQQSETLYLRIADVLASPDPDMVIISTIRSELSDYGYTY